MISSDNNPYQLQTRDNTHALSNLISSTPLNPIGTNVQSILVHALPPPLAAPPGWRSEIVQSNSPIPIDTESHLTSTNTSFNNNYQVHNTTHTANTYQTDHLSSGIINNSNEYTNASTGENALVVRNTAIGGNAFVGGNSFMNENTFSSGHTSVGGNALIDANTFHRNETVLSDQQKRNIIHTVEHQQPPPLIVRKSLPNNTVTYQQNVSVRYLQPPTPPPPGPLIIREIRPPPPPPQPPIQIRQRPPPVPTPPPLVLRERPPPLPPRTAAKVVEKLLPPLPQAARRVVVERFGPCPPKPSDVVIERWLPYKQSGQRRILLERAAAPCISQQEPNLLILHDSPRACVRKEFINQGVVRTDPHNYVQRYGAELGLWQSNAQHAYLVGEASRAIPPPATSSDRHDQHDQQYCSDDYQRSSSPYISSSTWERARVSTPLPRSSSYHYESSRSDPPYNYCAQSSYGYEDNSRRSYDDYATRKDNYMTMKDVTSSWNNHCRLSSYNHYPSSSSAYNHYPSSSSYPSKTIRVGSDSEFRRVLCDLTNGHVPSALQSY